MAAAALKTPSPLTATWPQTAEDGLSSTATLSLERTCSLRPKMTSCHYQHGRFAQQLDRRDLAHLRQQRDPWWPWTSLAGVLWAVSFLSKATLEIGLRATNPTVVWSGWKPEEYHAVLSRPFFEIVSLFCRRTCSGVRPSARRCLFVGMGELSTAGKRWADTSRSTTPALWTPTSGFCHERPCRLVQYTFDENAKRSLSKLTLPLLWTNLNPLKPCYSWFEVQDSGSFVLLDITRSVSAENQSQFRKRAVTTTRFLLIMAVNVWTCIRQCFLWYSPVPRVLYAYCCKVLPHLYITCKMKLLLQTAVIERTVKPALSRDHRFKRPPAFSDRFFMHGESAVQNALC